jgi:hypothetical protein
LLLLNLKILLGNIPETFIFHFIRLVCLSAYVIKERFWLVYLGIFVGEIKKQKYFIISRHCSKYT